MSPKRPFVKVWWSRPNVTDNSGPAVRIESTREPGQKFTYGKHVVTYRATDLSNNTAICNFNVVIASKSQFSRDYLDIYIELEKVQCIPTKQESRKTFAFNLYPRILLP